MNVLDSAKEFMAGIRSVIDVSGAIRNIFSGAVSDGIENAFKNIKMPLERFITKIALIIVSWLLIVWGMALFLDNFVPYRGLGFIIVGSFFGMIILIFFREKE